MVLVAGVDAPTSTRLISVDTSKLLADVVGSRDCLFDVTSYQPGRFETPTAALKSAA